MFCLSKGLGAPVGSLLVGPADVMVEARRIRKLLGGGMRQAGVLAAAGILAITEQVRCLDEDHKNALRLAQALEDLNELKIDQGAIQTNMIFARVKKGSLPGLMNKMRDRGVLIYGFKDTVRLVTHHDFKPENIKPVVNAFTDSFRPG